ncbi:DNA replication/repair protein RecF [Mobilicoccus pelagius]|uniref:DNA replication and repair protein RecF n=1 Tax=Mobilicoccus pelagius NBRC 104925 TaxID=1089455 RepID=H5USX6_9MICO|nr:DNA replication/repair protein RecF [Mobilicoccus pelagius]GAB48834.1 DNA replication/repair protein RecF [Mobilicoccus pelagius NBRC 104925]
MYLRHLSLGDFRSYPSAEVALEPGVSTLVGLNGVGKTNLVEAVGYLASLSSHRVAQDAPLVRHGAERAIVRGAVVRDGRETLVELEIVPGRANRARLNRTALRPREVLGTLRTVLFAPEDLALVKGDPGDRRRFLDDLLVSRQPRWAGVRSDYDKILRQRNALLRAASPARGSRRRGHEPAPTPETLEVWDDHLALVGGQLLYARLRLLRDLRPLLREAYQEVSAAVGEARTTYRSSLEGEAAAAVEDGEVFTPEELRDLLLAAMHARRGNELDRGVSLVGPHRDDLVLSLGDLPAKGYASHGESWSFALALKLAAYHLLRHDLGDDPVLILDDVFAELDARRRTRLAGLVADGEQVLITAAVGDDVPEALRGARFGVRPGHVEVGLSSVPGLDGHPSLDLDAFDRDEERPAAPPADSLVGPRTEASTDVSTGEPTGEPEDVTAGGGDPTVGTGAVGRDVADDASTTGAAHREGHEDHEHRPDDEDAR